MQCATAFKGNIKMKKKYKAICCIFDVYREVVSTEMNNADLLEVIADVFSKLRTIIFSNSSQRFAFLDTAVGFKYRDPFLQHGNLKVVLLT